MGEEKYPDVIELKLKLRFSPIRLTNLTNMRKFIEIPMEVLERLLAGKCVEGSLRYDAVTGKIVFKAYNRQSRQPGYVRPKDKLLASLEHGWLKESPKCIKYYCAVKKSIGIPRILCAMDREMKIATAHLVDREIVDRV